MLPVITAARRAISTQFLRFLAIFLTLVSLSLAFGLGELQVFKARHNCFPCGPTGNYNRELNFEYLISRIDFRQVTDLHLNDGILIMVLIVVSVALAGGVAYYYYRSRFLIPLRRLSETVKEFVDGEWEKRAFLSHGGEICRYRN